MDTAKPDSKTPVTTPNTLCDSIDENLNEDAESDLLLQKDGQKSNSDSPNSKAWSQMNADRSSETAFVVDSKEKLEETNRIQRLTEQFGKIDDYERELTPERIDQMAVMNVMKYGNKRFCTHCQKFKVCAYSLSVIRIINEKNSLKGLIIAVSVEYASFGWIIIAHG